MFDPNSQCRVCVKVFGCCWLVTKSCQTLCEPMNCSLPGSSVHGFSMQEYWNGFPCPPPGDLPNPGIKPTSPTLQVDLLFPTGKVLIIESFPFLPFPFFPLLLPPSFPPLLLFSFFSIFFLSKQSLLRVKFSAQCYIFHCHIVLEDTYLNPAPIFKHPWQFSWLKSLSSLLFITVIM